MRNTIPLALAAALAAMPAHATIFGDDDRYLVTASFPVGQIKGFWGGKGSAFLIDECRVLTASHVIASRPRIGQRVRFEIATAGGKASSKGRVLAYGSPDIGKADYKQDWALVVLDDCLGSKHGYLPIARLGDPTSTGVQGLAAYGFPSDKGGKSLYADPSCKIIAFSPIGLRHDCATRPGNSGGPLVRWNANRSRYEAVAINVAGDHTHQTWGLELGALNVAVEIATITDQIAEASKGIQDGSEAAKATPALPSLATAAIR